jgi:hypothetical protein
MTDALIDLVLYLTRPVEAVCRVAHIQQCIAGSPCVPRVTVTRVVRRRRPANTRTVHTRITHTRQSRAAVGACVRRLALTHVGVATRTVQTKSAVKTRLVGARHVDLTVLADKRVGARAGVVSHAEIFATLSAVQTRVDVTWMKRQLASRTAEIDTAFARKHRVCVGTCAVI